MTELFLIFIIGYLTYLLAIENRPCSLWTLKPGPDSPSIKLKEPKSFIDKRVGLLNHLSLSKDEGLLFIAPSKIHTKGMNFSIDIVGLNRGLEVVFIKEDLAPENTLKIPTNAYYLIELSSGTASKSHIGSGTKVSLEPKVST